MKKPGDIGSELDDLEWRHVHSNEDRHRLASIYRGRAAALERLGKADDWEEETTDVFTRRGVA